MNRGKWGSASLVAGVSLLFLGFGPAVMAEDAAPAPVAAAPVAAAAVTPAAVAAAPEKAAPEATAPVAAAPAATAPVAAAPAATAPEAVTTAPVAPVAESAPAALPAKAVKAGTVTANVLNLRARPGVQYEVVAKFGQGDKVDVVGEMDDWLEIMVPPRAEAFLAGRYVDQDSKIIADRIRVHSGPGIVFSTYGFALKGVTVKKLGEATADGWQKIEAPAGLTGWVSKKFVTYEGSVPTVTSTTKTEETAGAKPVVAAETVQTETATAAVADESKQEMTNMKRIGEALRQVALAQAAAPAAAPAATVATVAAEVKPPTPPPALPSAPAAPVAVVTPAVPVAPVAPPAPVAVVTPVAPVATVAPPAPLVVVTPVPAAAVVTVTPVAPVAAVKAPAPVLVPPEKVDAVTPVVPAANTPVSIPAPTATVATVTPAVAEAAAPLEVKPESGAAVTKDGIISSLKEQSSAVATHLLSVQMNQTLYPASFLISTKVMLSEWEGQNVRIYGKEIWYPGWKRAVIEVTGVQKLVP